MFSLSPKHGVNDIIFHDKPALESKPLLQSAPRNTWKRWLAPGLLCKALLFTDSGHCPRCICIWTGDTCQNFLLLQHGMAKALFQSLCHLAPLNLGIYGLMTAQGLVGFLQLWAQWQQCWEVLKEWEKQAQLESTNCSFACLGTGNLQGKNIPVLTQLV